MKKLKRNENVLPEKQKKTGQDWNPKQIKNQHIQGTKKEQGKQN
jgi:hypothetical protein